MSLSLFVVIFGDERNHLSAGRGALKTAHPDPAEAVIGGLGPGEENEGGLKLLVNVGSMKC